jgi:16S rRNA processing protein RimM
MNKPVAPLDVPGDLIELGRVLGAHGIKGWIKIQPFSSDSTVLSTTKRWWLAPAVSPLSLEPLTQALFFKPVKPDWARIHGSTWLAALRDVSDRNQAEALKGVRIFVSREDFPALEDQEYYWIDLIGCDVMSHESGQEALLGLVQDVLDNPAHPILSVRRQTLKADGERADVLDAKGKVVHSLIPFVAAHIDAVDLAQKRIHTQWPADF